MQNLQLQGINMYGGQMGDFWDDYRKRASDQNQQQIDFDTQKSFLMNPAWHETLQRRSGKFNQRTYGKGFKAERPEYDPKGVIGHTKYFNSTDATVGGIDPKKGATYSGPQFNSYRRG